MNAPTPPAHRSYSQLSTLRRCGLAYKYGKIDGVVERPSTAAVAGSAFHKGSEFADDMIWAGDTDPESLVPSSLNEANRYIAEAISKAEANGYPVEEWKRYGRRTVEKPNAEDIVWFQAVGLPQAMDAYVAWRLDNPYDLLEIPGFGPAIEVPFEIIVGGVTIRGFIDRVMVNRHTGAMFLLDMKSGRKPENDEQLALYRQALLTQYGIDVQWGIYLYGLKTGSAKETHPIDISHWTLDMLEQTYTASDEAIRAGIFIPHPGEQCAHCGFTDICPFFKSAI